jgi:hypothetical protein
MNALKPTLPSALQAAAQALCESLQATLEAFRPELRARAEQANFSRERQELEEAAVLLEQQSQRLLQQYQMALEEVLRQELAPAHSPASKASAGAPNWESLQLVEDVVVNQLLQGKRLGARIEMRCEAQMRELSAYAHVLLQEPAQAQLSNPLRGEVLGLALYRAIDSLCPEEDAVRTRLLGELGDAAIKGVQKVLQQVLDDLHQAGAEAAPLKPVMTVMRSPGRLAVPSEAPSTSPHAGGPAGPISTPGALGPGGPSGFSPYQTSPFSGSVSSGFAGTGSGFGASMPGGFGASVSGPDAAAWAAMSRAPALEPQFMGLLRQLSSMPSGAAAGHTAYGPSPGAADDPNATLTALAEGGHAASLSLPAGLPGGLMAANLITTHREELIRATHSSLDHLVIDIIGTLFDQILSDRRVPPAMAHQIARLQLPVLRVALRDPGFFSSRKHPVRRFVNRLSALGSAYEDLESGEGASFLSWVRSLVGNIVDGDFDQLSLYSQKLDELERFTQKHASEAVERQSQAVSVLQDKEEELKVQQRYMMQLQAELTSLNLPDFLKHFLAHVWSQAIVLASRREGPQSEAALAYRQAASALALSVQAQGAAALKARFKEELPQLLNTLKSGLKRIGWPAEAQRDFFAALRPAHAKALQTPPASDLDHKLQQRQFQLLFQRELPKPASTGLGIGPPEPIRAQAAGSNPDAPDSPEAPQAHFTSEEAALLGLVDESVVDWQAPVDIDLGDLFSADAHSAEASPGSAGGPASDAPASPGDASEAPGQGTLPPESAPHPEDGALQSPSESTACPAESASGESDVPILIHLGEGVDIQLDIGGPEGADAAANSSPAQDLQIGNAYRMLLKDQWQTVRLNYISPARSFFVFTHGKGQAQTVSFTARMVGRMAQAQRLKPLESSFLIERASARARKQLAALRPAAKQA